MRKTNYTPWGQSPNRYCWSTLHCRIILQCGNHHSFSWARGVPDPQLNNFHLSTRGRSIFSKNNVLNIQPTAYSVAQVWPATTTTATTTQRYHHQHTRAHKSPDIAPPGDVPIGIVPLSVVPIDEIFCTGGISERAVPMAPSHLDEGRPVLESPQGRHK